VTSGFADELLVLVIQLGTIDLLLGHVPDIVADDPCAIAIVSQKAVLFGQRDSSQE
jgi:hypothetical protein